MLLLEAGGGGSEAGEGSDGGEGRTSRNHRIEELRREVEEMRARIADTQDEQRRAVLELSELLEEKRHLAQRARQQQRSARMRHNDPGDVPQSRSEE
jgi:chromosome segregation ATPase